MLLALTDVRWARREDRQLRWPTWSLETERQGARARSEYSSRSRGLDSELRQKALRNLGTSSGRPVSSGQFVAGRDGARDGTTKAKRSN